MRSLILVFLAFTLSTAGHAQRSRAVAKLLVDSLYTRLIGGANFKDLVVRYSEDPGTRDKGGIYPDTETGAFVPEFEDAVLRLSVNGISAPFVTPYGYHIVQLLRKQGSLCTVRHLLIKFDE